MNRLRFLGFPRIFYLKSFVRPSSAWPQCGEGASIEIFRVRSVVDFTSFNLLSRNKVLRSGWVASVTPGTWLVFGRADPGLTVLVLNPFIIRIHLGKFYDEGF